MARILLIEDNNDIQEILYSLLSEDHEVLQAFSGTEGLRLFQQEAVDLVLLDIMLPGKNGDQVLEEIRLQSQVPVIMMTALGDKHLISQYLLAGANDYIVKPFNLDEVAARVTVQLRNHVSPAQEAQASQKLSFKNLVLNPETFELESGEQTLRLGKKEFQIFETLLAHPKKIFTKEELYEAVWEEVYLPGDNTLNAQLSNLRKKIAQLDPDEDYIETVWGLGYARLLSALKDLQEQIQQKLQNGSGVRLTSQVSKKELVALTKQVSDLFDQIERTNRIAFQEKKTLDMAISNIAHDIRTPLTIASGYTQQIIKGGTQEEEKLKKIASNLQVVSKRLESLLEYRRLMEGAIQPRISDVDLSQVLTQQLFQYYDSLSEAGIDLEVEMEEHLHYATDPELWERLLQNMLSNVLKHGKDQARLTLTSDADMIRVELRNIVQQPIQHLDQLASRFYSENLSDTEESSGLGLYIIQNFVEILGGDLQLATEADWFILTITLRKKA